MTSIQRALLEKAPDHDSFNASLLCGGHCLLAGVLYVALKSQSVLLCLSWPLTQLMMTCDRNVSPLTGDSGGRNSDIATNSSFLLIVLVFVNHTSLGVKQMRKHVRIKVNRLKKQVNDQKQSINSYCCVNVRCVHKLEVKWFIFDWQKSLWALDSLMGCVQMQWAIYFCILWDK